MVKKEIKRGAVTKERLHKGDVVYERAMARMLIVVSVDELGDFIGEDVYGRRWCAGVKEYTYDPPTKQRINRSQLNWLQNAIELRCSSIHRN